VNVYVFLILNLKIENFQKRVKINIYVYLLLLNVHKLYRTDIWYAVSYPIYSYTIS
jgi:hypothetical protein